MLHKMTCAALLAVALPHLALAQDSETTTTAPATSSETAAAPAADMVVATVGDTEITVGHVLLAQAALPQQYRQMPIEMLFPGLVDQLIQQVVLSNELEEPSPRIEMALENQRRSLSASEVVARFLETPVADDEIQAAYDAQYGSAGEEKEFNASHILVETEEEANALVEELNEGVDFAELATERSTGPSGPNGGSLGWFGAGMMVPEFEAAVMELEDGEVSAPVQTQFGWHVVKLNESRIKEAPALEDVREELELSIQQEKVKGYIDGLVENANVDRSGVDQVDPATLGNVEMPE